MTDDDLVAFGDGEIKTLVSSKSEHKVSIVNDGVRSLFSLVAIKRRIMKQAKSPAYWKADKAIDIADLSKLPDGLDCVDIFNMNNYYWYIPEAKLLMKGGKRAGLDVGALARINFLVPGTKINITGNSYEATSPSAKEYKTILPALQAQYKHNSSWIRAVPHKDMIPLMGKAEEIVAMCTEQLKLLPGVEVYAAVPCFLVYTSDGGSGSQSDYIRMVDHVPVLYEDLAWQIGISLFGMALEGQCLVTDQGDFIASAWCMRETPDKAGGIDLFTGKNNKHTLLTWCAGPMLSRFGTGAYAGVQGDSEEGPVVENPAVKFEFAQKTAGESWREEYSQYVKIKDINTPIEFVVLQKCYKRLEKGKKITPSVLAKLLKGRARKKAKKDSDIPQSRMPFKLPVWVYMHKHQELMQITNVRPHPYYPSQLTFEYARGANLRPLQQAWKFYMPLQPTSMCNPSKVSFLDDGRIVQLNHVKAFLLKKKVVKKKKKKVVKKKPFKGMTPYDVGYFPSTTANMAPHDVVETIS